MYVEDVLEGAELAGYETVVSENSIIVSDDSTPGRGLIHFTVLGHVALIDLASSEKDERRMLKKMGLKDDTDAILLQLKEKLLRGEPLTVE